MYRFRVFTLLILSMSLAACGSYTPEATLTPQAPQVENTVTIEILSEMTPASTPTPPLVSGVTEEPVSPTTGGRIEVHIPYLIATQDSPPIDVPECAAEVPFSITQEDGRNLLAGTQQIHCEFENPLEDSSITIYVVLEFESVLNGELLEPTPNKPSGWLDAYLVIDGTITQYYTGYPPEAVNPCPESSPCSTPTSEVIPLPFAFEEGSTITTPWTFTLHLQQ